jgi:hypothetical protein
MPEPNTSEPARRRHLTVLPDSAHDLGLESESAPARTPGGEPGQRAAAVRRLDAVAEPPAADADPITLD